MEVTALGKKLFLSLLVVDLNRKCPVQFAFSLAVKTVSSVGNSIPMMCWAALTTQGWGWGGDIPSFQKSRHWGRHKHVT